MFHVNVVGWNAGEEIVPHNLMGCWNTVGPKKFFGRWNWSQFFGGFRISPETKGIRLFPSWSITYHVL